MLFRCSILQMETDYPLHPRSSPSTKAPTSHLRKIYWKFVDGASIPGGDKYQRSYCKYCSDYRCDVTEHKRVHTGECPFVCKVCQRSFSQSYNLSRHLLPHKEDKPYNSSHCGRCFADASRLTHPRKHLRNAGTTCPPLLCPHCFQKFSHVNGLETHYLAHREERLQGSSHATVQVISNAWLSPHEREWAVHVPAPSSQDEPWDVNS
ncbi:hypothetical protein V5799_014442 [Amblyomma americanum]|uniref:C2H2-type domain-containing protein n=1 Tax=Amblyomma americanum TaxID=6943 RepID=A0AAQ4E308_AMBAM